MEQYEYESDEALIRRLRQGDEGIAEFLVEKYKELVRKKARTMYLLGGDTDDLIQEGMIGLFKAVQSFRPEKGASFRTFAGLCIDRQIYSAVKNSARQKHMPLNSYVPLDGGEQFPEEAGTDDPEAIIIDRENTLALDQEIRARLSPVENKVLDRFLQGDSYIQIADALGRSPKSVGNALQRIRNKIRLCVEKYRK